MSFLTPKKISRTILLTLLAGASTEALACKMMPLSYDSAAIRSAMEEVIKSTNTGSVKSIRHEGSWFIDVQDSKNCRTYEVKVTMPGANCSMKAEILSQKDC